MYHRLHAHGNDSFFNRAVDPDSLIAVLWHFSRVADYFYSPNNLNWNGGAPLRLPKPLSDQFHVPLCMCARVLFVY